MGRIKGIDDKSNQIGIWILEHRTYGVDLDQVQSKELYNKRKSIRWMWLPSMEITWLYSLAEQEMGTNSSSSYRYKIGGPNEFLNFFYFQIYSHWKFSNWRWVEKTFCNILQSETDNLFLICIVILINSTQLSKSQ